MSFFLVEAEKRAKGGREREGEEERARERTAA